MSLAAFDFLRALAAGWLYRIRAERRLGEILADSAERGERATRGRQEQTSPPPTLDELGISRDLSSRAQAIASVPEDAPTAPRTGWRSRALLPAGIVHAMPFRAALSDRAAVAVWQGTEGERRLVVLPAEPADFAAVWLLDAASRTASTIGRPLHVDGLDLGLRALAPDLPPGVDWQSLPAAEVADQLAALLAEARP